MRTLKKTLCLVLCLAMMVGLCAVGASATFTDVDEIENKEAVDLMTGIGIIEGYTDGSFNPSKILNRAEAAKILAYLLLGKNAAEALPKADTKFTDVKASHWASGFIGYCADQGILAGKGHDEFKPADTLKAAEWGKMLLCALGYKAENEGLTGNGWDFNVTRLVAKTKLFDGFNSSAEMSRDAACLMAYNALTVPMVEYGNGLTVTTGDGTTVETNTNAYANGLYLADNYNLAIAADATAANDFDRQGFSAAAGSFVTGVITTNSANDPTSAAYTELNNAAATTYKIETGADLLGHFVKVYKDKAGNAKSVTDIGSVITVAKKISAGDAKTFKKTFGAATVDADATVKFTFTAGKVTATALPVMDGTADVAVGSYVFNNLGKLVAYIASESVVTLDVVTKVNTKAGEESIKISGVATALANNADEDVVDAYDGIAAKDVVLVTKTGDSYVLTKAEKVNGAATKAAAAAGGKTTITIDGTDYAQSSVVIDNADLAAANTVPTQAQIKAGATFTLYLDADGKWIACTADQAAAAAADYRFVAAKYKKTVSGTKGDVESWFAVTYNSVGEAEDVLYAVGADDGSIAATGLYSLVPYTTAMNANLAAYGATQFTALPADTQVNIGSVYAVSADAAAINMTTATKKVALAAPGAFSPYIGADTKVVFIENVGLGNAASVKASVKAAPVNFNFAANTISVIYTLGKDGNAVANTFFYAGEFVDAGATAASSIYFDGAPAYDSFDSTGYTYTVYDVATGAEKTIKTKAEIAAAYGGFYKFAETEDGYTNIGAYQVGEDTAYAIGIDVAYAGAYQTALHSTGWGVAGPDVEAKDAKFVDLRSAAAKAADPLDIETVADLVAAAAEYNFKFDIYMTKSATGAYAAAFIAIKSATAK